MARTPRRDARPGTGPGRGAPRTRASQRSHAPRTGGQGASTAPDEPQGRLAVLTRGLSMTRRAIILLCVFALLVLSYASSLRIYVTQQQQIAQRRAEIAESELRIYELQDRIDRWQDPDYVKAQARERLGWVVPGETGYVVLGPDGRPIDGSSAIARNRGLDTASRLTWWQKVWDSVVTADHPGNQLDATPAPGATPTPRPSPSRIVVGGTTPTPAATPS